MMRHLLCLSVLLVASSCLADPMPPGPFKKYDKGVVSWSKKPVGGYTLLLAPTNPVMKEGSSPSTDTAARMDCTLLIKNVGKKPLAFQRRIMGAFQLQWEVVDAAGKRWSPTFLPPPMPRPGQKYRTERLAPGKAAVLARLHGISGFRRAGKAHKGRWYRVLPAGTYRVKVSGVDIGTLKQRLTSGPMTIRVLPAGQPVKGLKLTLTAASASTPRASTPAGARPVKLTLTFTNVGKKPITLDVLRLEKDLLRPRVQGNYSRTTRRWRTPPRRKAGTGFVVLRPGKRHVHTGNLQAPGPFGRSLYRFSGPGWYQLRVEYVRARPAKNDCFTGTVSSNVVWLQVAR